MASSDSEFNCESSSKNYAVRGIAESLLTGEFGMLLWCWLSKFENLCTCTNLSGKDFLFIWCKYMLGCSLLSPRLSRLRGIYPRRSSSVDRPWRGGGGYIPAIFFLKTPLLNGISLILLSSNLKLPLNRLAYWRLGLVLSIMPSASDLAFISMSLWRSSANSYMGKSPLTLFLGFIIFYMRLATYFFWWV